MSHSVLIINDGVKTKRPMEKKNHVEECKFVGTLAHLNWLSL